VLVVVLAVAVAAVAAFAAWRLTSGDDDKSAAPNTVSTTPAPSGEPSVTPTPTTKPKCEGPNTSLADAPGDSLLPDCGAKVVTTEQEKKSGLDLGCGGKYPVIMYKTTTTGSNTSICGTDASGEDFRMVTKPNGGSAIDMPASYDPQRDAFVARNGGTKYAVLAYDGTLLVTSGGRTQTQDSDDDWISLDNEEDYD